MIPAPSLPAPSPLRVCAGCGTIAPVQRSSCVVCSAAFPPVPLVAPGGAGTAVFARIHESDFECRGCGLRSPTGVGFNGEAECLRCGLRQAFAEGQWEEALAVAHGVADLSGPDPEGRFPRVGPSIAAKNPHRSIGVEHTRVENTQSTTIIDGGGMKRLSLRISVSPGHPLCAHCKAPLSVELDGRGHARSTCTRCGDQAVYTLPEGAAGKAPLLRAVIAADQRTDRPAATIDAIDAAGVAAIRCPSCGAALSVTPGAEMAACQFCRTTSRIARRAWVRASGAAPHFEPFWVLLDGPSIKRRKLSGEKVGDDDDDIEEMVERATQAAPPPSVSAGSSLDPGTIRMIVALAILVMAGVVYGGAALYQSLEAPARPAPRAPARPPGKR